MSAPRNNWLLWLMPIAITVGATLGLRRFGRLADRLPAPDGAELLRNFLFVRDPLVAREVIMGVLEVLAGIFAITITVLAIIVQLSATRYTSRVVDLFLAHPLNVFRFFAYVVPLIYGFRLSRVRVPGVEARISAGLFMILATGSIALVIPSFRYGFVFAHPRHIIARSERSIEGSLQAAVRDAARVRGVRKSQALLAACSVRQGRPDWAGRIHEAMKAEPPEVLTALRGELFAVESQDFREIEDRGVSFYYVDPSHRASVSQFFAWLLGEQPLPREAAESA